MTSTNALPNLGCQQSPICLSLAKTFDTGALGVTVEWNTLTVKYVKPRKLAVTGADGVLIVDGEKYVPVDFHWHFPAEHTNLDPNGDEVHWNAEVHIVHVHEDDVKYLATGLLDWLRIAVLGIFLKDADGASYPAFPLEAKLASGAAGSGTLAKSAVLPNESQAKRYDGSLTTPPYSENVTFVLFTDVMTASADELADGGNHNNRRTQAVNRRAVVQGKVGGVGGVNS